MWNEMIEMFLSPQFLRLLVHPDFMNLALKNAKTSIFKRAFFDEIRSLVPFFDEKNTRAAQAGIRAQVVDSSGRFVNDMLVIDQNGSTHILNAVSPGMTSSLAFAGYVVDQILERCRDGCFSETAS